LGSLDEKSHRKDFLSVLDTVYGEAKRLTKMVEELLNVSRIEDGRLKLSLRRISMVDVVDEVINEFTEIAKEKNIKLQVRHQLDVSNSCFVVGDKDKLKQILMNLIDNAIKFTGEEGKVTTKCFVKDKYFYIQIMDNGAGIAPSMMPRILRQA